MKKIICLALSVLLFLVLAACSGPKEVTDMSYSTTIGNKVLDGLFTGTIENKLPNGHGTFTYSDDSTVAFYTGTWENGILVGEGSLEYDGFIVEYGDVSYKGRYEGETLSGIPNGNGTFVVSEEKVVFTYSGEWTDGTIAGNGEMEFSEYTISFNDRVLTGTFKGTVVDGLPSGDGEFSVKTEEYLTYLGNWAEGIFAGNGTLETNIYSVTFSDGTVRTGKYVGETLDGLASGNGLFTTKNDSGVTYTHDGAWENGLPHGYGRRKFDSPDYYVYEGTFVNGDFIPTPLEYFVTEGTLKEDQYTIIDRAQEFLKSNPDLFLTNDLSLYEGEIDKNFQYKAFSKNQSTYGDKLVVVTGRIGQILERTRWGADHTFCLIYDGSYNYYYVNMYGFADGIYEGDRVTMTALPLDYFTWTSTDGDLVWSIACAAVNIKK